MIHTIQLGVGSESALDFWAERLAGRGYASERAERSLSFEDYDGLRLELVVADDGNPPLRAEHPEVPAEHAILGVEAARAYIAWHSAVATTSPGFAIDEDPEHLGEELRLPTQHEHLRPQLERHLTPLANPRAAARQEV
jgi:glyoxalase family protein